MKKWRKLLLLGLTAATLACSVAAFTGCDLFKKDKTPSQGTEQPDNPGGDTEHTHTYGEGVITTNPTCTTDGVKTFTCTAGDNSYTEVVPALGHDYGEAVWTWTADNTATATFSCSRDAAHVEVVTATIASQTTPATYDADGKTVYTATVAFEGKTYTDSKEVTVPALRHNLEHHEGKAATCTDVGWEAYDTCKDADCDYTTYKEIPALGHNYGAAAWTWAADNTATAKFTCSRDAKHVEVVTATVTSKITPATCVAAGKTVYTATVTFEGKTYTDTKEVAIPALGHDYGEAVWTWAADNTAKATFTCSHDAKHVEVVTATVTSQTPPATCEVAGKTVYTATVSFGGKSYTNTKEVEIAALKHNYTLSSFVWTDYTAQVKLVCANDSAHVVFYDATVTSAVTTEPTAQSTGVRTYTATYGAYTDTKTEEIPRLSIFEDSDRNYTLMGNYTLSELDIEATDGADSIILNYICSFDLNGYTLDLNGYIVTISTSKEGVISFRNGTITNGTLNVSIPNGDIEFNGAILSDSVVYELEAASETIRFSNASVSGKGTIKS
ncbi:MAG: hypothetical protein J6Z36_04945, partial [Clostridia bacterium]|nr:hypothetical protein [Clostridia bacterium]